MRDIKKTKKIMFWTLIWFGTTMFIYYLFVVCQRWKTGASPWGVKISFHLSAAYVIVNYCSCWTRFYFFLFNVRITINLWYTWIQQKQETGARSKIGFLNVVQQDLPWNFSLPVELACNLSFRLQVQLGLACSYNLLIEEEEHFLVLLYVLLLQ